MFEFYNDEVQITFLLHFTCSDLITSSFIQQEEARIRDHLSFRWLQAAAASLVSFSFSFIPFLFQSCRKVASWRRLLILKYIIISVFLAQRCAIYGAVQKASCKYGYLIL